MAILEVSLIQLQFMVLGKDYEVENIIKLLKEIRNILRIIIFTDS